MTKGGIYKSDKMDVTYYLAIVSRRWTTCLFYTLLNITDINAKVILKSNKNIFVNISDLLKRIFLKKKRWTIGSFVFSLPNKIKVFLEKCRSENPGQKISIEKGRCFVCSKNKNRLTTRKYEECDVFIRRENSKDKIVQCFG